MRPCISGNICRFTLDDTLGVIVTSVIVIVPLPSFPQCSYRDSRAILSVGCMSAVWLPAGRLAESSLPCCGRPALGPSWPPGLAVLPPCGLAAGVLCFRKPAYVHPLRTLSPVRLPERLTRGRIPGGACALPDALILPLLLHLAVFFLLSEDASLVSKPFIAFPTRALVTLTPRRS